MHTHAHAHTQVHGHTCTCTCEFSEFGHCGCDWKVVGSDTLVSRVMLLLGPSARPQLNPKCFRDRLALISWLLMLKVRAHPQSVVHGSLSVTCLGFAWPEKALECCDSLEEDGPGKRMARLDL